MELKNGEHTLYVKTLEEWRNWLQKNNENEKYIWLIIYNKKSKILSVGWYDAIEHALCYGWVDSKANKRDAESVYLKFTPRNPKSKWGRRNKERAMRLTEQGYMKPQGQKLIDIAKATGNWDEASL